MKTNAQVEYMRKRALRQARDYSPKPFILFRYGIMCVGWALLGSPLAQHIQGTKVDNEMFGCYSNPREIEVCES
jgi:hypothetical protein